MGFPLMGRFTRDKKRALEEFSLLKDISSGAAFVLEGQLDVKDDKGRVIDTYVVRISQSVTYPKGYPVIEELEGKIPKNVNWHCNKDGTLCIAARPIEIIDCRNGINLSGFIKNRLIPHLAIQSYRRDFGEYPYGEYSHYEEGVREAYVEILDAKDWETAKEAIKNFLRKPKRGKNATCYCGSGKRYKRCHGRAGDPLRSISPDILKRHLIQIDK